MNKYGADVDEEDQNLDTLKFQQIQDHQYGKMLPKNRNQSSNSYFLKASKYQGKSYPIQQLPQENISEQDQEDNKQVSQEEQDNGLKMAIRQIKSEKQKRSQLLEQDIMEIDRIDNKQLEKIKKDETQFGNPQKLKSQLISFSKMVEVRVFSQKNIEQIKRYPFRNFPHDQQCNKLMKNSQKQTISGLAKLITNYENIVQQVWGPNIMNATITPSINQLQIAQSSQKSLNLQNLWKNFSEATDSIATKLEQGLIQWSQKTVLLRNSTNRSQYNSLIMQTPIGQAKKAMKDWSRVCKKSQLKRSPFRILFEGQQNLSQNSNPNIYDDLDLVQQLQKIYQHNIQEEDKQFLINDTMKYLQNRSLTKPKKDVDRKASKNRKIRYNIHPKLLNFMPCQNQNFLEAHQEIVRNLFNRGQENQKQKQDIQYIDL